MSRLLGERWSELKERIDGVEIIEREIAWRKE
jgi:hypothetical protein